MILCDTNIFIEIYKGNTEVVKTIEEIGYENIAISDISCAELFYGARNKHELRAIKKDIEKLSVLSVFPSVSSMAVSFVERYSLSHKLSMPDALIASTAIYYNVELYTLNLKDFRFIDGVKLYL